MGAEPPDSRTPYIIICSGQTALLTTNDVREQVRIACQCSRDMCMYLGYTVETDEFTPADTKPLSDKMHEMQQILQQGHLAGSAAQLAIKVNELMALISGLHVKFSAY